MAAGGDVEVFQEGVLEVDGLVAWSVERFVDAVDQERDRLAHVADDDLQLRIRVEQAAEDHAYDLIGGVDGESPGGAVKTWKVGEIVAVVRLDHRRVRRT